MAKNKANEIEVVEIHTDTPVQSEKERLLELYKTLKDLGVNSIGDLEVKISRAE